MKKTLLTPIKFSLFFFIFFLLITSCASRKNIIYFQDVQTGIETDNSKQYETVFQPDDLLIINVSALDMDAVRPFNLVTSTYTPVTGSLNGQPKSVSYLVDSKGTIDFPVLGNIHIGGLSKSNAIQLLKDKLSIYVKDPIVNIEIINFKVSVLGEVKNPGTFTIPNERITVLEAIGLAGDMTISGKRDNVLIIRDVDGKKTYTRIDMRKKDVFSSPIYYLNQNDVIYIEPNNARVQSSTYSQNTSVILTLASVLISLISILTR